MTNETQIAEMRKLDDLSEKQAWTQIVAGAMSSLPFIFSDKAACDAVAVNVANLADRVMRELAKRFPSDADMDTDAVASHALVYPVLELETLRMFLDDSYARGDMTAPVRQRVLDTLKKGEFRKIK